MGHSFLMHHGVKGMQWGVRNGPPYPIDQSNHPVYIKKGTKIHRLSIYDERGSTGHAYVNYLKSDARRYEGFFGARLKALNGGTKVYDVELEAKKDLFAPSKQERVKTFIELYNEDPRLRKELGAYHKEDWHDFTPLPKSFYEQEYANLPVDAVKTKGYETFVRAIGGNEYVRNAYFKRLTEKGYHFVTDDMDAGVFGKAPSIILDRKAAVKYKGQKELSNAQIQSTWKREGTYLSESIRRKRETPKALTARAIRIVTNNFDALVSDLTAAPGLIGAGARTVQYNADFAGKTLADTLDK